MDYGWVCDWGDRPRDNARRSRTLSAGPESTGVGDCGVDFELVADHAGGLQSTLDLASILAGDFVRIESTESFAKVPAFVEDASPTQTGLHRVEKQVFEKPSIIMDRHAPQAVVVGLLGGGACPGTAMHDEVP